MPTFLKLYDAAGLQDFLQETELGMLVQYKYREIGDSMQWHLGKKMQDWGSKNVSNNALTRDGTMLEVNINVN